MAIALGMEYFVIDAVSVNHTNDCEGACQDILKRWLNKEFHTGQNKRTWSTLLSALGRAGFVDLENSLRREQFRVPCEL